MAAVIDTSSIPLLDTFRDLRRLALTTCMVAFPMLLPDRSSDVSDSLPFDSKAAITTPSDSSSALLASVTEATPVDPRRSCTGRAQEFRVHATRCSLRNSSWPTAAASSLDNI